MRKVSDVLRSLRPNLVTEPGGVLSNIQILVDREGDIPECVRYLRSAYSHLNPCASNILHPVVAFQIIRDRAAFLAWEAGQ